MSEETEETWVFTFAWGSTKRKNYVRIPGDFDSARDKMMSVYGKKWAFQYTEKEFEHQVEAYALTEIKLGE